jgi:hypothetical protein
MKLNKKFLSALVVLAVGGATYGHFHSSIPFNSQQWKASDPLRDQNTRYGMSQDLISRQHLIGLTRSQVVALLGPPYVDGDDVDLEGGGRCDMGWTVGTKWMSLLLFTLDFDKRGRVVECSFQTQD